MARKKKKMDKTTEIDFYGKGDPLMEIAFADYVRWAWGNPEIQQAFERETGMRPATDPMGIMIDEAVGYDKAVADRFVRWVVEEMWGKGREF